MGDPLQEVRLAFSGILNADDAARTAAARSLEASIQERPALSVDLLAEICVNPPFITHCLIYTSYSLLHHKTEISSLLPHIEQRLPRVLASVTANDPARIPLLAEILTLLVELTQGQWPGFQALVNMAIGDPRYHRLLMELLLTEAIAPVMEPCWHFALPPISAAMESPDPHLKDQAFKCFVLAAAVAPDEALALGDQVLQIALTPEWRDEREFVSFWTALSELPADWSPLFAAVVRTFPEREMAFSTEMYAALLTFIARHVLLFGGDAEFYALLIQIFYVVQFANPEFDYELCSIISACPSLFPQDVSGAREFWLGCLTPYIECESPRLDIVCAIASEVVRAFRPIPETTLKQCEAFTVSVLTTADPEFVPAACELLHTLVDDETFRPDLPVLLDAIYATADRCIDVPGHDLYFELARLSELDDLGVPPSFFFEDAIARSPNLQNQRFGLQVLTFAARPDCNFTADQAQAIFEFVTSIQAPELAFCGAQLILRLFEREPSVFRPLMETALFVISQTWEEGENAECLWALVRSHVRAVGPFAVAYLAPLLWPIIHAAAVTDRDGSVVFPPGLPGVVAELGGLPLLAQWFTSPSVHFGLKTLIAPLLPPLLQTVADPGVLLPVAEQTVTVLMSPEGPAGADAAPWLRILGAILAARLDIAPGLVPPMVDWLQARPAEDVPGMVACATELARLDHAVVHAFVPALDEELAGHKEWLGVALLFAAGLLSQPQFGALDAEVDAFCRWARLAEGGPEMPAAVALLPLLARTRVEFVREWLPMLEALRDAATVWRPALCAALLSLYAAVFPGGDGPEVAEEVLVAMVEACEGGREVETALEAVTAFGAGRKPQTCPAFEVRAVQFIATVALRVVWVPPLDSGFGLHCTLEVRGRLLNALLYCQAVVARNEAASEAVAPVREQLELILSRLQA
jgi:hypothetical protein